MVDSGRAKGGNGSDWLSVGMCMCVRMCVRMCVCMCVRMCVRMCVHACDRAKAPTPVRIFVPKTELKNAFFRLSRGGEGPGDLRLLVSGLGGGDDGN